MNAQEIRTGKHRVVFVDANTALIVDARGPFTELDVIMTIKTPEHGLHPQNCAQMLCQALNAGCGTYDFADILAQET